MGTAVLSSAQESGTLDASNLLKELVVTGLLLCAPVAAAFVQTLAGPDGQETVIVFRQAPVSVSVPAKQGQRLSLDTLRRYVRGANVGPESRAVDRAFLATNDAVGGIPKPLPLMPLPSRALFNLATTPNVAQDLPVVELLVFRAHADFVALQPGVPSVHPDDELGVVVPTRPGPPTNLRLSPK
jgi:hypothetical protein